MLEKRVKYKFNKVVEETKRIYLEQGVQALYQDEDWCVYVREADINPDLDTECYIDEYPEVTDDDEEIYPEFIVENDYELVYTGEMLQDVIVSALSRKKNATNEELMETIDYYDEHDTFLEI